LAANAVMDHFARRTRLDQHQFGEHWHFVEQFRDQLNPIVD
jgi:hypothetical protein